jgi:plasmid maintenance system killer protein
MGSLIINYTGKFIRAYNKLERELQSEVKEKIALFKEPQNHKSLVMHKLHRQLKNQYSFSVNYKYRVIFEYKTKQKVILLTIGDHDIYK